MKNVERTLEPLSEWREEPSSGGDDMVGATEDHVVCVKIVSVTSEFC